MLSTCEAQNTIFRNNNNTYITLCSTFKRTRNENEHSYQVQCITSKQTWKWQKRNIVFSHWTWNI